MSKINYHIYSYILDVKKQNKIVGFRSESLQFRYAWSASE